MKRKTLSLLLCLALLCSVTAPALAGQTYRPPDTSQEWLDWKTQFLEGGGAELFVPSAWYYSNYDMDVDEFMEQAGFTTLEELEDYLFDDWLASIREEEEARKAYLAEYEAAHPGALSRFDADDYFMEHLYVDPKEDFMFRNGLRTQEEFQSHLLEVYGDLLWERERIERLYAEVNPDSPAFDADAYFRETYGPDYGTKEDYMAYNQVKNDIGFTYAMLESWYYDHMMGEDLVWSWDEAQEEPRSEPAETRVMVNGTYLTFPEERKPHAGGETVHVPARELSAALGTSLKSGGDGYIALRDGMELDGWEVFWDEAGNTAVLLDRAGYIEKTDASFTVLNGVLAKWGGDPGENRRTGLELAADYTRLDSLDGDSTFSSSVSLDLLRGPAGAELAGSYDLTGWAELLAEAEVLDEESRAWLALLQAADFEARADRTEGALYLRHSALPRLFSFAGRQYPRDIWVSGGLEDLDLFFGLPDGGATVGELLYERAKPAYSGAAAEGWRDLREAAGSLTAALGDERFVRRGTSRVLTLDREALAELLHPGEPELLDESLKSLGVTLTVRQDGTMEGSLSARCQDQSYYALSPALQISAKWTLTPARLDLESELHFQNQGKLNLTLSLRTEGTEEAPHVAPPPDAAVLPADELDWAY